MSKQARKQQSSSVLHPLLETLDDRDHHHHTHLEELIPPFNPFPFPLFTFWPFLRQNITPHPFLYSLPRVSSSSNGEDFERVSTARDEALEAGIGRRRLFVRLLVVQF